MHIVNGDRRGRHRVKSAKITLNGVRVVGSRDFSGRRDHDDDRDDDEDDDRDERGRDSRSPRIIDRPVSLLPTNTLEIKLKGARGSVLTLSVLGTKIPPVPTTLTPNPLSLTIGATGTLTATLAPVPSKAGNLWVRSSDEHVARVKETVRFGRGQTRVTVPVWALGVGSALITVKLNRGRATSTVVVAPPHPTVTSLLPDRLTITQGGSGTLTVTLNAVQSTDTLVELSSSSPGVASVAPSVTVPAGQMSAGISVSANTPGPADITASLNGSHATSMVTVTPALPSLVSLLPPTSTVMLGANATLAATISATQPTPTVIALTAEPGGIVTVPPAVVVPIGQTTAEITIGTVGLGTAMVKASLNGTTAEAAVHVTAPPPALTALQPPESSLTVGATETLTVKLNAGQPTNTEITLAVDLPAVLRVPESVTVPAGQTEAGFTVTGLTVGDAVVTATLVTEGHGTTTQQAIVHVTPPAPAIVGLGPSPLKLQEGATGELTVTLNAAQLTDTSITLTTDVADVIVVPESITVPAGQTRAGFAVKGLQVGTAIVTATLAGDTISTARATVEVTPPPTVVTGLTPVTLSLPKGRPGVLRVTVSPAPAEATPVDLSSSDAGIAGVPTMVTIPAGALFADFPVLSVGEGSATITASLNGGTAQAQITVTPAELVLLTLAPLAPTAFTGETEPFTATGTFTDGTTQDVTTQVTWSSSDETVATIAPDGLAVAKAAGTTTITATAGPIHASTILTVMTPAPTCPAPPPAVGWWPGEGTANDVAMGHVGVLKNGTTFAPGQIGQAFLFDGVDDLVHIPAAPDLDLTTAVAIEAWVHPTASGGPIRVLAGRPAGYQLALMPGGFVRFAIPQGGQVFLQVDSTSLLPLDTWTQVVGTYDAATGELKVYMNGVLEQTVTTTGPMDSQPTTPFQIGGFEHPPFVGSFFTGRIDEVHLYARALTAAEVQSRTCLEPRAPRSSMAAMP